MTLRGVYRLVLETLLMLFCFHCPSCKERGQKKTGLLKIPKQGGGGSDPNPLLGVYLPSYFWHAKMAPNQSCMPVS